MKKLLVLLSLLIAVSASAQYHKTFQLVTLAKDTANTTTSPIGCPLKFYVDSQSTYTFEFYAPTTSSATTGITYTVYYPTGSTIVGSYIGDKVADTLATATIPTDSTATAAFNTNSSGTYPILCKGTIFTGSNRGIVRFEFTKPTSGTATLKKGGYGKSQKQ